MARRELSAQLLAVHPTIHTEALPHLYGHNTFDIAARSSLRLLTSTISPASFSQITALMIDFDTLQDFSFQLAKPTFTILLTSLCSLETKHWRNRVSPHGSAFLWRDVKSYERSLCLAAQAILQKAPNLSIVVQREWTRPTQSRSEAISRKNRQRAEAASSNVMRGISSEALAMLNTNVITDMYRTTSGGNRDPALPSGAGTDTNLPNPVQRESATTVRVKWRFLAERAQMGEDEAEVDIDAEVALLTGAGKGWEDEGARQMALDPI